MDYRLTCHKSACIHPFEEYLSEWGFQLSNAYCKALVGGFSIMREWTCNLARKHSFWKYRCDVKHLSRMHVVQPFSNSFKFLESSGIQHCIGALLLVKCEFIYLYTSVWLTVYLVFSSPSALCRHTRGVLMWCEPRCAFWSHFA